jgi:hypothetical protein
MAKPARELPQLHSMSDTRGRRRHNSPDGSVNATTVGRHLDLTHQRVLQLVEESVLQRLPNGRFNVDDCRVRYIRWLRDSERRSAKSKADQEFTQAKAELIRIRIEEKKKTLIQTDEAIEVAERLIGTMLMAMGGMAPRVARIAGNSIAVRREVDAIVYETRVNLANTFNKFADEAGEPPLELPPVGMPPSERPLEQPITDDTEEDEPVS